VGVVNDYRSHCRLEKFRGVMYRGERQRCNWSKTLICYVPSIKFQAKGVFEPITALYFPPYVKRRNFANRQCERQWLTPPGSEYRVEG